MTDEIDWTSPGGQAQYDQWAASIAVAAKSWAIMYKTLITEGLEPQHALFLVTEAVKVILNRVDFKNG